MKDLFCVETEDVEIIWSGPDKSDFVANADASGFLKVVARNGAANLVIKKYTLPEDDSASQYSEVGPALFEQIVYGVSVRSKMGKAVNLLHADPNIERSFSMRDGRKFLHGTVNFRSEVGFSTFTATIDGAAEVEFTVEVFPSKLDYKTDYTAMVAETQEIIYGLVYDYLKSTYQKSKIVARKKAGSIEWLELLKYVVKDLEQGLSFIQKHPSRTLTRQHTLTRVEKVKKCDAKVRRSLLKCGAFFSQGRLKSHPFKIEAQTRATSLVTAEHRWLVAQLSRIKAKLLALKKQEMSREPNRRRTTVIADLSSLLERITRAQQIEVFQDCNEAPPAGFASLLLLSGPGYRECYQACRLLSFGLSVMGGPINLSLKDLNTLYEYWCFLTVAEAISEYSNEPIQAEKLLKPTSGGLELQLKKGMESKVSFGEKSSRRIELIYNKKIIDALVPQQPDITISMHEQGWPSLNVLLDAKYRVRDDVEYRNRYGTAGPPEDAINVLHRYRDAILQKKKDQQPRHSIIQAAALFPTADEPPGNYSKSKLWIALDQIGIGAIPLLPSNKQYLRNWLTKLFSRGAWSVAEQALGHTALVQIENFKSAAKEGVIVAVLRNPSSQEHFDWIKASQLYYMPMLKTNRRQFTVKYLAMYSPDSMLPGGAVSHLAEVVNISVVPRNEIVTPWSTSRDENALQTLYRLGDLIPIVKPIKNREEQKKGQRFSSPRWTTRLALERACNLNELLLETEQEWRFYEDLIIAGYSIAIAAGPLTDLSDEASGGRAIFNVNDCLEIRFLGFEGFLWQGSGSSGACGNAEIMMTALRNLTSPIDNE